MLLKSIAFFNNKGGVGKTTLLCNISAFLALKMNKKVCIIDADPQCNATQYFFDETELEGIYSNDGFTIQNIIEPLSLGEGFSHQLNFKKSRRFGVDVIPGDPKLALTEDLLARDWGDAKGGDVRGIRTNLVFSELLGRLNDFDYVFLDVSPSLGAINRSILLSADAFVSPMSIDIFSLKAFENIASWINQWSLEWERGIENVSDKNRIPKLNFGKAKFLGYVTQQYLAKKDSNGRRRGVQAYENIRMQIDDIIKLNSLDVNIPSTPFEIGTVPNLFSLIPMSQSKNTPVFELQAKDGVVGAHFAKVKDALEIYGKVSKEVLRRLDG
jgi:cellulose biosynthesis protein BcsQ